MHTAEISHLETDLNARWRAKNEEMQIAGDQEEARMQHFRIEKIGGIIRTNEEDAEINLQMAEAI